MFLIGTYFTKGKRWITCISQRKDTEPDIYFISSLVFALTVLKRKKKNRSSSHPASNNWTSLAEPASLTSHQVPLLRSSQLKRSDWLLHRYNVLESWHVIIVLSGLCLWNLHIQGTWKNFMENHVIWKIFRLLCLFASM